jgi:hypothetical protein
MAKVLVGKASDIGEGKMAHLTAGGKEILVAELHEGDLNGKELICPWHRAKWDVTTGSLIWFPQKLRQLGNYKVMVENGTVYVEV